MKKCTYLIILIIVLAAAFGILYSQFINNTLSTVTNQHTNNEVVSKAGKDKAGGTGYGDISSSNDGENKVRSSYVNSGINNRNGESTYSNEETSNSVSSNRIEKNNNKNVIKENINNENVIKGNVNNENVSNERTNSKITNNNGVGGSKDSVVEKQGLVELIRLDDSFVIDIKYATTDNFAKKKIYTIPMCLIQKNTAQKLIKANNEFKTLGYRIKVFDAYRPHSAQQVLWDAAKDKSYVANPKKGSMHNRGAAVDVTLVDSKGTELKMPSGYDEFSERAHLDYSKCDKKLIENRELLGKIMVKYGFKRISNEWWHFEDTNFKKYPLLDIAFEEFVQEN